jgi:hypothetical protein
MNKKFEFEGAFGGKLEVAEVSDRKWIAITVTDPLNQSVTSVLIDAENWADFRSLYGVDVRYIEEEPSDESPAS